MFCRSSSVTARLLVAGALSMGGAGCKRQAPSTPGPSNAAGQAAASASAPPAPAVAAGPDAKVLPPDYDPAHLVRGGADPLQVYLDEPRHPKWAPMVEELIGGQIRRDVMKVVPETKSVGMGCRTLSCLIVIDVPAEKRDTALLMAGIVTLGPITVNLGPSPEGQAQLLFLTEPRMADPGTFTFWHQKTRKRILDAIREGKQRNPLPIPVADLPAD